MAHEWMLSTEMLYGAEDRAMARQRYYEEEEQEQQQAQFFQDLEDEYQDWLSSLTPEERRTHLNKYK